MIGRFLDFLFSLQRVHITSGTRFAFVWDHVGWIVLGVIVLAVLGYMSYMPQAASSGRKRAMGVVRAVLLAVVLMLACRPELVVEHEDHVKSVVAVWVDSSASMTLEDPYAGAKVEPAMRDYAHKLAEQVKAVSTAPAEGLGTPGRINRYQLATATLADGEGGGWLKELVETQDVMFFTGASHAEPLGIATRADQIDGFLGQLKRAKPAGDTTDVPTVVREILDRVQGQRVSAIVLLTDGQTTEKGSRLDQAAAMAQQADTKVFAVMLGQEDEPFDLKLTTMRVPESTFVKDPVWARIHVAAAGITAPTAVRINIYRKPADGSAAAGEPLATKEVTIDPNKKEVDVEVPVKLVKKDSSKSERFDLIARIEPVGASAGEELTLNNNERTGAVTVLDAQINVLYVEGYPRWEFRYLKNELIREPTVNVSTLLESADPDFTQDADPRKFDKVTNEETFPGPLQHFPDTAADLAKYDVLLLGDIEPTYFSPTQQKLIVDWVKTRGGGMGWIAGAAYNPESYRETELEVLLPVTPDEIDPRARVMAPSDNTAYNPVATPAGRETNLFRFFDDPETSWKQLADLPELYWYKPVPGLKPGAVVLAVHPKKTLGGNPAPLLVMRQFGAGPVLFSAYTDTWRWRRYTGEPLFQSYWLQLCRLLYANKALGQSKRMELASQNTRVEIGGAIKVSLTVKDPTLVAQLPAEVPVLVMDKEGRTVETITLSRRGSIEGTGTGATADAGAMDKLEGTATAAQLGEFTLNVKAGSLPVDIAPVELVVEPPQREFETITADGQSLQSIATKTTGKVVTPNHAASLMKEIPDRSMPIITAQSEELWNKPFALILVVLLATGEWLIRKRAGLI